MPSDRIEDQAGHTVGMHRRPQAADRRPARRERGEGDGHQQQDLGDASKS